MDLRTTCRDPRVFQIGVLTALLGYGLIALRFEVRLGVAAVIVPVTLVTQLVGSRLAGTERFDPRSAAITALSLCLLLRTTSPATAALAALLAMASKFVLRVQRKHVFNPSAFGLAAVLALREDAWLSAGQWGSAPILAAGVACLGSLVLRRAERSDVTWAFLGSTLALVLGRTLWLGDPWSIPLRTLQSGALLIFAFFMISDPKTTPDSRAGRILFAMLVATGGFFIQYEMFGTNGLLWSLVLCAPWVPVLDRLLPGGRTPRSDEVSPRSPVAGGFRHAPKTVLDPGLPGLGAAG